MSNQEQNLYFLMGTNMIAYVLLHGIKEHHIELTDNNRVKYWFEDTDELHRLVEEFKDNKIIRDFIYQQNQIKETIFKLRNEK